MVQEITVLKCTFCETFQSQIVKKLSKWECKVCGTKQSIKKVYGRGSGKDCRLHTQKLNALKGERDIPSKINYDIIRECLETQNNHETEDKNLSVNCTEVGDTSKWTEFIHEENSSVSRRWNKKESNISNDKEIKITNSLSVKKRKYNSDQNSHNKSPVHLSFPADLNVKIQTENKNFRQMSNKNIERNSKINLQSTKEGNAQKSSVIWEKYLKVEKNEEFLYNSTVTSLKLLSPQTNSSENKSNLHTSKKRMTLNENQSFSDLCNQTRKHVLKDKQKFLGFEYFDENTKVTPGQQSSKQQLLFSSQSFESNYTLTDVDFRLDF